MCGIVGFSGKRDRGRLRLLLKMLEHRGRDEDVDGFTAGVNFGMTRLAMNDLTPGLYPQTYQHYHLVYNGEIYNFPELKKKLQQKGYDCTTRCDAEVILPLFDVYGIEAFRMLEGMFAIAIIDTRKKKVILARDTAGEKPLYYLHSGSSFAFSSEMKALLCPGFSTRKLDLSGLQQYLQQGFVSSPHTMVRDIKKLPARHCLEWNIQQPTKPPTVTQYWYPHIAPPKSRQNDESLLQQLDTLLDTSVKMRLLSDVPIGGFLSGGVDSSLITYYATKHSQNFRTYSVIFPDSARDDESQFSKKVALMLGTDHTEIPCTHNSLFAVLDTLGKDIDEPLNDPATLPTYLLAQEARKKQKGILTGEGSDEVFGGYDRYWKEVYAWLLRRHTRITSLLFKTKPLLPAKLAQKLNRVLTPTSEHYHTQSIWTPEELQQLIPFPVQRIQFPEVLSDNETQNPFLGMQLTDLEGYLPDQLCMKVDKMTMRQNLEARAPYLDSRVIEFGLSLPLNCKMNGNTGKPLLKQLAEQYLPADIVRRKKHGFSLPVDQWFREELQDVAQSTLGDLKNYPDVFDAVEYEKILKDHLEGAQDSGNKIWGFLVLFQWMKEFSITP